MHTPPGLQYGFAAAFIHLRTIALERRSGAPILDVGEVAGTDRGDIWIVDRRAQDVKIFAPDGRLRHVLRGRSRLTELCAPVGLSPFHGSWMAVLDAGVGRVHYYDVRGRRQGGFDLPQVEEPRQIRSLGDDGFGVIGRGGDGRERWVHLFRPDGRHAESVFAAPSRFVRESLSSLDRRPVRAEDAVPHAAAAGRSLWLAYEPSATVVWYDFSTRLVHSFPLDTGLRPPGSATVCGLFAAHGGRVIVMHRTSEAEERYAYDLYTAAGEPVITNVRSTQRLVGVEGRLFFSLDPLHPEEDCRLRVCRLRDLT